MVVGNKERKDPWFTFEPVCSRVVVVLSDFVFVEISFEQLPFVAGKG